MHREDSSSSGYKPPAIRVKKLVTYVLEWREKFHKSRILIMELAYKKRLMQFIPSKTTGV